MKWLIVLDELFRCFTGLELGSLREAVAALDESDTLNLNDDDYSSVEDMMAENEDEQNAQTDSVTSAAQGLFIFIFASLELKYIVYIKWTHEPNKS
ncbi:hypothetical protein YC2023_012767 [Brassica napus]